MDNYEPAFSGGGIRPPHKFTLIELLIVIAIIVILASLLAPSLRGAIESARSLQCLQNLRQCHNAIFLFADNNNGRAPSWGYRILGTNGSVSWAAILNAAVLKGNSQINIIGKVTPQTICCPNAGYLPTDDNGNYVRRHLSMNRTLSGASYIPNSETIPVTDETKWPGSRYNSSPDAAYYLGTRLSSFSRPSKHIAVTDVDGDSADAFYAPNYYSSSTHADDSSLMVPSPFSDIYHRISNSTFSLRHIRGYKNAQCFLDGHTALVEPIAKNFRPENLLVRP